MRRCLFSFASFALLALVFIPYSIAQVVPSLEAPALVNGFPVTFPDRGVTLPEYPVVYPDRDPYPCGPNSPLSHWVPCPSPNPSPSPSPSPTPTPPPDYPPKASPTPTPTVPTPELPNVVPDPGTTVPAGPIVFEGSGCGMSLTGVFTASEMLPWLFLGAFAALGLIRRNK